MIKRLSIFFILLGTAHLLQAQTVKTGVLVVGNTPGGVAAAIQSARSGVKTTYLTQSISLDTKFSETDLSYLNNIKNHYALKERKKSKATDSILSSKVELDKATNLIKSISDTVKNLILNHNNAIDQIKQDGKGWEIRLKGGQKIKADVVVDATENQSISSMLNIDAKKTMAGPGTITSLFENKQYRSSVALGFLEQANKERSAFTIPLGALIPQGLENFIMVPQKIGQIKPLTMSVGQAAGTIAGFCSFFKTTTKNINVRVVQGELLAFDALLFPYSDIDLKDPNFLTFQRMGLSGLLKAKIVKDENFNKLSFDTASTITAGELRTPMKEYYSRSQIWFADNKKDTLSIEDAISLFKFIAARGDELNKEIEEGWKVSFKLNSNFDPKRNISRKEFAVLADRYLQPYNIRVDLAGNLLR